MISTPIPPIGSIFIALLGVIFLVRHRIFPNFRDIDILLAPGFFRQPVRVLDGSASEGGPQKLKLKFGLGLSCKEIREMVEELNSKRETEAFLLKSAKDLSAESVKLLLDCEVLTDSNSLKAHFFTQFADWTTFKLNYPDLYEEIIESESASGPLDVNKMSSYALGSFPIEDLLKKLKKLDEEAFIYKLPMKQILLHLIKSVRVNFGYWKVFTETCFVFLDPESRILVMNFFSLVVAIEGIHPDDLILLHLRSEVFLLIELKSLQDTDYLDPDVDLEDKMAKFLQIEKFFDKFVEARRSGLLRVPLVKKLREALRQVCVISEDFLKDGSLGKLISTTRPYDPMLYCYEEPKDRKPIKEGLLKIFRVEDLFQATELSFDELIENVQVRSEFCLLEILRAYSSNVVEILSVLHRHGAVYEEVYYVLEWIKKAFELGSAEIVNFHLRTYERMIKFDHLRRTVLSVRFDFDTHHFYTNCESEMFRTALILPSGLLMDASDALRVDFVDFTEGFQVLTAEEAISLIPPQQKLSSALEKFTVNQKLDKFMKESFEHFLKHREALIYRSIVVEFEGMEGQDTGGLARHFISICLTLLVEEKFGFFHFCKKSGRYVPRTMLDANILGFLGMLHGQCLKVQLKVPWMIDFDIKALPIHLSDIVKIISERDLVPTCEDLLVYVNEKYRLFEERFDLSCLKVFKVADANYFDVLQTLENAFWQAGFTAYKSNLLKGLDASIVRGLGAAAVLEAIWEILRPARSSEIGVEEFMKCFEGGGSVMREAIRVALSRDPSTLIPLTLKFATGSTELPAGGLSSLHLTLRSVLVDGWSERRLPQASTCTKTINWSVAIEEDVEELEGRFLVAVMDSNGFELN